MAAMMSSSDSMLLSGSSYLTRDVYRQVATGVTERREAVVGRIGVVAIALLSFVASLFQPGTLVDIGETAFGGFAQLALPVLVALYWSGTTRYGMYAGIGGSQLFYLGSVFLPFVPAGYALPFAPGLGGWSASVVGMGFGLVLTVGVSALTGHAAGEDAAVYQRLSAD
jgi:SSS family solute:Na+ symporter